MKMLFALLLICAAAFLLFTSSTLPELVASNFGVGGKANGFTAKDSYMALFLTYTIILPLFTASITLLLRYIPNQFISIPNSDYWLAPERKTAALKMLTPLNLQFAAVVCVFMCFIHWLIVQANAVQPQRLHESWLIAALLIFFGYINLWLISIWRRFRLPT